MFTSGYFRSCSSDQAGSISETHLLRPLSAWIKGMCPYHLAKIFSINWNNNVLKLSYHKMCNCGKSKKTFCDCFHIQFYSLEALTTSFFVIFDIEIKIWLHLSLLPNPSYNPDPPYSFSSSWHLFSLIVVPTEQKCQQWAHQTR